MTPEEQTALAELHKKSYDLMKGAFSAMRDCLRMTPEELRHSGNKTNESAVVGMYKYYQAQLDKLTQTYFRDFPDQK